jgi:hypothetical protein
MNLVWKKDCQNDLRMTCRYESPIGTLIVEITDQSVWLHLYMSAFSIDAVYRWEIEIDPSTIPTHIIGDVGQYCSLDFGTSFSIEEAVSDCEKALRNIGKSHTSTIERTWEESPNDPLYDCIAEFEDLPDSPEVELEVKARPLLKNSTEKLESIRYEWCVWYTNPTDVCICKLCVCGGTSLRLRLKKHT